jgi:hypothetical protein
MARSAIRLLVCLILFGLTAAGQNKQQSTTKLPENEPPRRPIEDRWGGRDSGLPNEMTIRMAIERAESDHRKILIEVDKLNELSSDVARGYHERGKLSDDELKKLNTIQKLAKRVLDHALGDEVEEKPSEALTLAEAVDHLQAAAASIQKTMRAETRFEVSAVVVANSNELISLTHFIKRKNGKSYRCTRPGNNLVGADLPRDRSSVSQQFFYCFYTYPLSHSPQLKKRRNLASRNRRPAMNAKALPKTSRSGCTRTWW